MKYWQTLSNLQAFRSFRKTSLAFTGSICTLGGLVADVLQPIAPFVAYLFIIGLVIFIVLAILYLRGKKDLVGAIILTGVLTLVSGSIAFLQSSLETTKTGIVASSFPAIAELQESLGLIAKKIDTIKEDTEEIKASNNRIENQSANIANSINEIKNTIGIVKGSGIISSPSSPEDYYHNARISELGGDYSAARRSYLEYFKFDLAKLDPHLRFTSFLKLQEGSVGARESYNEIAYRNPSDITSFTKILLLNADARIEKLQGFLAANPDFAPAAYYLSLDFSEKRLGTQNLSDKRNELKYLEAFNKADTSGGLLKYFIDQELVAEWQADAAVRITALQTGADAAALANPVSINWMPHNAGWNGNIQILEAASDIRWNIQNQSAPRSTGNSNYTDPRTGKIAPNTLITLPRNQSDATIEIRYTDTAGQERGPYSFAFQTSSQSDDANRRILEMTETSWLSFREYEGTLLVYFTHLLSYRGAIAKIEYGIDSPTTDQELAFPAYDGPGIAPLDSALTLYIPADPNTQFATVRLTYKSGQKSQLVRFNR